MWNEEGVREGSPVATAPMKRDDGPDVVVKLGMGGFIRVNGTEIPCTRDLSIIGRPGDLLGVRLTIMPRSLQVL